MQYCIWWKTAVSGETYHMIFHLIQQCIVFIAALERADFAVGAYRKYGMLKAFSADAGYRGSFISNVEEILGLPVDISEKIVQRGFHVIKNRWKEERTFAWFSHSRRLSKDFEITTTYFT